MSDEQSDGLTPEERVRIRELLTKAKVDPDTPIEQRERMPTEKELGLDHLTSLGKVGRYIAVAWKVGIQVAKVLAVPAAIVSTYEFYAPVCRRGVDMLGSVVERLESGPPTSSIEMSPNHVDRYFVWDPTMRDRSDQELNETRTIKLVEGTTLVPSTNTVQLSSAEIYNYNKSISINLG